MKLKYKSWQDISINVFDKLRNINVKASNNIEVLDNNITLLSILCDCTEDEITNLTTSDFTKLLAQTEFIKDLPKVNIKDKYTLNGKEYRVFTSLKEMTVAQYLDFQTYYKDKDKYFKELLSCFIIPKGKKYGDYNIDEVIDDIGNHLSIVDANSVLVFFFVLFQSSIKVMLRYCTKKMKKMKNEEEKEKMQKLIEELTTITHLL